MPGAQHRYHAGCPFCNDRRHHTARALLAVVEAAANLRSTPEECDGWGTLQAALSQVSGATTVHDAAPHSGDHHAPLVTERCDEREHEQ